MGLASVLLLAVGLAMDTVAVCAARGLVARAVSPAARRRIALYFGGSQAIMPLVGWALARALGTVVVGWLPLAGGAVLLYLGVKMGRESFRAAKDDVARFAGRGVDPFDDALLMPLAVATSVDALAAGLVLDRFAIPAVVVAGIIGAVTATLAVLAAEGAKAIGERLGSAAQVLGAFILVGLGLRLLVLR
jgi:putative Mn2+ efflux pump MntP